MCGSDIFLGILAIIFPPIAVWVKRGLCSADSLINIALCMLGFIPGLIHAWYIIALYPSPTYEVLPDDERGHGSGQVYYIAQPRQPHGRQAGYGTVAPAQAPSGQYSNQQHATAPVSAHAGSSSAAPHGDAPPTYQDALIQGDNKVQTHH